MSVFPILQASRSSNLCVNSERYAASRGCYLNLVRSRTPFWPMAFHLPPDACVRPKMVQGCILNVYGCIPRETYRRSQRCVFDSTFHRFRALTNPRTFRQVAVAWKHSVHPNIVPLMSVTIDPLQLISEWMSGGDLMEYITNNPDADRLNLVSVPFTTCTMILPPR